MKEGKTTIRVRGFPWTMSDMNRCPQKSESPAVFVFLLFALSLSVFICVHLWFQIPVQAAPRDARVLTGIDVLEAQKFAPLAGKRVGLITNQTGVDRNRRSTIDLLAHAPGLKLVALFSPEHGIRGAADERVPSAADAATGLPVYSLYGDEVRPTDAMVAGLDARVFDVQVAAMRSEAKSSRAPRWIAIIRISWDIFPCLCGWP